MLANERGSTLVLVLLVVLIFSVLGLSVIGNVVGEGKRVSKTNSDVNDRNLARDGLTYFEAHFKDYSPKTLDELKKFISKYKEGGEKNIVLIDDEQVKITAIQPDVTNENNEQTYSEGKINRNIVTVTSEVINGDSNKSLVGRYELDFDFDIDGPTNELGTFDAEGLMVDFRQGSSVLNTALLGLADIGLIETSGSRDGYYLVPQDSQLGVELDLLFELIGIDLNVRGIVSNLLNTVTNLLGKLLDGLLGLLNPWERNKLSDSENQLKNTVRGELEDNRFQLMENNSVIAMRKGGGLLNAELLKVSDAKDLNGSSLVSLSILNYPHEPNTNVIINGYYADLSLTLLKGVEVPLVSGYQNISFKKLGVFGDVIIQQNKKAINKETEKINISIDRANQRRFSFNEGLFVRNSIIFGGDERYNSNLLLRGDMAAKDNLVVHNAEVVFGDTDANGSKLTNQEKISNVYVHNNAMINQSCIKEKNTDYQFRLFSNNKITLENNSRCASYDGFYFAEDEIVINTHGKDITINGELIGNIIVKGGGLLTVNKTKDYGDVEFSNIELKQQGRSFE